MSKRGAMAMLFESPQVKLMMKNLNEMVSFGLAMAPWGLPAMLAAGWMIWPALTTEFKQSVGLEAVPPSGQEFNYEKEGVGEVPELRTS